MCHFKYMKPIAIPQTYNYIATFLSLACNLRCSYCINYFGEGKFLKKHLSGKDWVKGLNRIVSRDDLPISLQGGEPSLHKDFIYILNNVKPELNIDILTNLQFDEDEFMHSVNPNRIKRKSPYASIRVSYHPETMQLDPLVKKVLKLQKNGFSIGLWGVMHPTQEDEILRAKEHCTSLGIDFRIKEFLGEYGGKMHGTYRYESACDKKFRPCEWFGHCNPCDIKVKTNRFQQFGHSSVEIKFKDQEV